MEKKTARLEFRISDSLKKKWITMAKEEGYTLSEFIITRVENNMSSFEFKEIFKEIDRSSKEDNKVDSNINQIAKWVNTHKTITPDVMNRYCYLLQKIDEKLKRRNLFFSNILKKISSYDR